MAPKARRPIANAAANASHNARLTDNGARAKKRSEGRKANIGLASAGALRGIAIDPSGARKRKIEAEKTGKKIPGAPARGHPV
ncbi:hypothetical protein GCM10008942_11940 [Rhizomicrobium electricum]|uniref:Uncharacterized protein n=1 Tax=Rhizomicrobium electricum TaxID=480070 RepID=A0ABN1EFR5_9PROT